VSLLLVSASFAVLAGALPLLLAARDMQHSVATLKELGRPFAFVYVNFAIRVAVIALALVTCYVVLRKPSRIAARWGLVLHAAMLFAVFWPAIRHGAYMHAWGEHPIRVAWLVLVGILLLPLRRFRDEWDDKPQKRVAAALPRIPLVTRVLLALMFLAAGTVIVFFGGWMLAGV
jgi:hypothetical protein